MKLVNFCKKSKYVTIKSTSLFNSDTKVEVRGGSYRTIFNEEIRYLDFDSLLLHLYHFNQKVYLGKMAIVIVLEDKEEELELIKDKLKKIKLSDIKLEGFHRLIIDKKTADNYLEAIDTMRNNGHHSKRLSMQDIEKKFSLSHLEMAQLYLLWGGDK